MNGYPRVSVVVIFLNGGRFIEEAVESVFAQSWQDWELLLVDDGSTDSSTAFTRALAAEQPSKVRYLEHAGHANLGMSASRNRGIEEARGDYVALLDADDVWLPGKLAEQVAALEAHPEAGMVYGSALYWRSWTGCPDDAGRDLLILCRVRPGAVHHPPSLVSGLLSGSVTTPCPSCILFRRDVGLRIGGFEPAFRTLYEDQVFFAKMALQTPILVTNTFWIRYRHHPDSACAQESADGGAGAARRRYLDWLESYLDRTGSANRRVRWGIRRERWYLDHPRLARITFDLHRWARRWRRRLMPWTPPNSIPMAPDGG
jgi:glycosyltransferase involved in cell wall biosynthesis